MKHRLVCRKIVKLKYCPAARADCVYAMFVLMAAFAVYSAAILVFGSLGGTGGTIKSRFTYFVITSTDRLLDQIDVDVDEYQKYGFFLVLLCNNQLLRNWLFFGYGPFLLGVILLPFLFVLSLYDHVTWPEMTFLVVVRKAV